MLAIRMLVTADGSPHGHTVYTYEEGEVYSPDSTPPATGYLMEAFVSSKRAIEVDADGNPVAIPAAKRAKKSGDPDPDPTPEPPLPIVEPAPAPAEAPASDQGKA